MFILDSLSIYLTEGRWPVSLCSPLGTMDLRLLDKLSDLQRLSAILQGASERNWSWWRFFFADRLTKLVYRAKIDYKEKFEEILGENCSFWVLVRSGRLGALQGVVPSLDFSSNGRGVGSLALLAFLLDGLDRNTDLPPGFLLNLVAVTAWPKIRQTAMLTRLRLLQAEVGLPRVDGPLPPIGAMLPRLTDGNETVAAADSSESEDSEESQGDPESLSD